jgi:uncharacterized protein YlxW (UPF0749 family)
MPSPTSSAVGSAAGSPGRRRRLPLGTELIAAAMFATAGALFVAGATSSDGGDLRVDRTGGLTEAIYGLADENASMQSDVDVLSARVAFLQDSSTSGPALAASQEQIAQLAPQVGLTELRGPGVTVSLDDADAPVPIPDGYTGDDYLVHQEDVQGVVNALWRGGASGITVMGQRLVSTSAVRCVGNTVILQGRVYSPPFVVAAVGDVARLEAALESDASVQFFREWSAEVGLGYQQTSSAELVLPAYTGRLSPKYAQVTS